MSVLVAGGAVLARDRASAGGIVAVGVILAIVTALPAPDRRFRRHFGPGR